MQYSCHVRRILSIWLSILRPIATILMLWKGMCVITGSSHPVMVVSSESMEPAFQRGDLILLWDQQEHIRTGEIPVVWFPGRPLPMVHRAIQVSYKARDQFGDSRQLILTKGDNNDVDDVRLYPPERFSVDRQEVVGVVVGYVPGIGRAVLALKESPGIFYPAAALVVVAGIFV